MEKRWIWPFAHEEQIGSGAMGVVFRARFVKNDRRVALKLLPKEVAANHTLAARFQREMEILKDLRHPHIVHAFGGTCEGDQWFYAMELIDGGTVGTLLLEQGKMPWRQAVEFGLQVCAALDYAHTRGVIHRDLKPGNLLLTRSGKIKLGDFGLALVSAETRLTAAGKTMGSLHYMAPEQIQGKPPLSNKTDLYALGCVMFELLCGRTPFTGEAMAEVLQQHIRQTPPKVSSLALDCPIQLEALIAELLQKDPDRRPPTAQAVANRLREIDQDFTVKAPRFDKNRPLAAVAAETASAVMPTSPRTWNRYLVAGLLLAVAVIGWLVLSRMEQQRLNAKLEKKFVTALLDEHQPQPVRLFAASALREIGPDAQNALPALLQALNDKDVPVRTAVVEAIGEIGTGDPLLVAELRKFQGRDDQYAVRDVLDKTMKQLSEKPHGSSVLLYFIGAVLLLVAGAGYWIWKQATAD
jgi:eukaryotic-like serine/threonine-protein kinase